MLCSFIICIPLAFYFQLAASCLGDMKIEDTTAKMSLGQVSEIFFMLAMPFFFARLGVKKMLLIGMLAWAARYALFAVGAADPVHPVGWMLMSGILLHGICYDFFFVTGYIYVDKAAPKEIRGAAQGFLVLVTLGAGMFIGAKVAGMIKANYTSDVADWQAIWMWPAGMAAVVLLLFGLLFRDPPKVDGAEGEVEEPAPAGGEPGEAEEEPSASTETGKAEAGETAEAGEDEAPPVMPIEGE